jgi:RimJ/RimL family protein N-acetyltransferase
MSGKAPHYIKPRLVRGRQLLFRDATAADAGFILDLRTDRRKAAYLSPIPDDLERQRAWLERYGGDDSQVYFIITNLAGAPAGTVRLYDRRGDSFCWGSWIKGDQAPSGFGVESALMVYAYALELGFRNAHFDVRKQNLSVCQFHERFGAVVAGQDEDSYFYEMSHAAIVAALEKYSRYLPDGVAVQY